MEPSNEQRAEWAEFAVDAYMENKGDDDDLEGGFSDLFQDMLHLLVRMGIENPLNFLYWRLSLAIDEMEEEIMAETWFTAAASTVLSSLSEAAGMYDGFKEEDTKMRSFADEDIEF